MSQFYQVFFDESEEHLSEMERLLLVLNVDDPNIEDLNAIFRAAHSIKGGSGTFGFTDMTEVTHVLENLLDRLRKGEMALRVDMIDAFLESVDVLKQQLLCHTQDTICDPEPSTTIREKLKALTQDSLQTETVVTVSADVPPAPVTSPTISISYAIDFTLDRPNKKAVADTFSALRQLGELEILAEPDAKKLKKKKKHGDNKSLSWQIRLISSFSEADVRGQFEFLTDPEMVHVTQQSDDSKTHIKTQDTAENDEGYGFFTELPQQAGPLQDAPQQDEGYGFFTEIPAPSVPSSASVTTNAPPAAY